MRAAHGADWTCPQALPSASGRVLVIAGGVLAVLGGVLWAAAGPALNLLAALALPAGLVLLASGFFVGHWPE